MSEWLAVAAIAAVVLASALLAVVVFARMRQQPRRPATSRGPGSGPKKLRAGSPTEPTVQLPPPLPLPDRPRARRRRNTRSY